MCDRKPARAPATEEGLQVAQRRLYRRLAQPVAGTGVDGLAQCLLNAMACSRWKRLKSRRPVEASKRASDFATPIDRRLIASARFLQIAKILALDPLVRRVVISPSLVLPLVVTIREGQMCAHISLALLPQTGGVRPGHCTADFCLANPAMHQRFARPAQRAQVSVICPTGT